VAILNRSIKSDFAVLTLCSLLKQSSLKVRSAMLSMVSSTGKLVKSEDRSYDTTLSWSLISISWSSSANRNMSLIVWPLTDRARVLASHPATLQACNCTFPWLIELDARLDSFCGFSEDRRGVQVLNPSGLLNPQWFCTTEDNSFSFGSNGW